MINNIGTKLREKIHMNLLENNRSIDFEKEVSDIGLGAIGIAAGLIGAWSLVCLAGGLIVS
ncbi:MAG: hypothetical protein ACP5SG_04090 [Dissulfurimicrobium sp.]|uniref:hypothetical protein n=1 Tax=Dissulfurimicrobium sp. TaxID=2022436 RepID=UPI003D0E4DC7